MKKCLFIIAVLIPCQLFSQDSYLLKDQNDTCKAGYYRQDAGTMVVGRDGVGRPIYVECIKYGINEPIAEAVAA